MPNKTIFDDMPSYPEFAPMDISHKNIFSSVFDIIQPQNSEFSFGYLFAWRTPLKLEVSFLREKFLVVRGELKGEKFFFPPMTLFPLSDEELNQQHESALMALSPSLTKIICADEKLALCALKLRKRYNLKISVRPHRDFFDYMYLCDDLAALKGDRYQSKRNFVNRFNRKYAGRFRYQVLDDTPDGKEMVSRCISFQDKWRKMKLTSSDKVDQSYSDSLSDEDIAARELLENFYKIKLYGCALMVDEEIVAFSIGEELNKETLVVHIEKADSSFQGSYQTMVKLSALTIKEMGYKYINKEEDLGIHNLRLTKNSYHPIRLIKKYEIKFLPQ